MGKSIMAQRSSTSIKSNLKYKGLVTGFVLLATLGGMSSTALAQQAGAVIGTVTEASGVVAPGVTIEARSPVLPGVRTATTDENGRYQLPLLPPGEYELTFTDPDGTVTTRSVMVLLQQRINFDVEFSSGDEIIVLGQKLLVDTGSGSLKNTIGVQAINSVPVGQEYRDLQKLIPGVQYSEETIRGPSAGASGQDNGYQFDGVDVSLPLFGTLSAEPSTHDIEQVSVVRGGAKAIGFNRTAGFLINTSSKRGTNEFKGEVGYQIQSSGMTADRKQGAQVDLDREWITANVGGPILKDKLFFYGSYYRPTVTGENSSNAYGPVGDFKSVRDEFFGKLTAAPTDNLLFDVSYRTSERNGENEGIGEFEAATLGEGSDASQDIIIAEGSWIIDDKSSLSFKFTDFSFETAGGPDTLFDLTIGANDPLPVGNLGAIGRLNVPSFRTGTLTPEDIAFNTFITPIVNQFSYDPTTGGGAVGGATTINSQDFYRTNFEIAYDRTFEIGGLFHDIHIGYQHQEVEEILARTSNGYGAISVLGGDSFASDGVTPVFYQARLSQTSIQGGGGTLAPPSIDSRSILQSIEINDTIEYDKWTFDVGVMISKDILYGQGLREVSGNLSGFELAPGNEYKMYTVDWEDMIQPRLGIRYDWTDRDTVYANFAKYNAPASSLARAASWDRNLNRDIRINYDQNGNFIEIDPVRSSSGKFFQDDLKPRYTNEYLVGWDKQVNEDLTMRLHARHRYSSNFWEDTPNNARLSPFAPSEIQQLGLYIPNLADVRAEIGGSSYVIAQLDTAYTKYWEAGLEAQYSADNWYLQGSYVWSSYRGNFDQDNTSSVNDANRFIGSSSIADGVGRQPWNNKEGKLRGDRPHQLKVYGYYDLPWNGRAGFYTAWQSGQPWEAWSNLAYRPPAGGGVALLPGSPGYYFGGSSTIRYSEPAGSNRSDSHFQFDLSYTQNFEILNGKNIELRADLFNVFNTQTGYNINPFESSSTFGDPRSYFNPRRLQLSATASF